MKIILTTWGTTGDVQPFIALAKGLIAAGHQVRLCTSEIYRQKVESVGAEFFAVGLPFNSEHFNRLMDRIIKIRNPFSSALVVAKEGILSGAKLWYDDCLKAMNGDFELSISHSADIPGQEAAIRSGLPNITVSYCPAFIKSIYAPPPPMPNWGLPVSWLLWQMIGLAMWAKVDPLFNEFIHQVKGKPRRMIGFSGMYSTDLNLVAVSPAIVRPPPDLPTNHQFTGDWSLDEPSYQPPTDLLKFINNGPKPIVVTFGSMGGNQDPTSVIYSAIQRTNQRAIIQSGWGNLGHATQPHEDIFFVDYVPHGWLFQLAKMVIHHGGAGTTTAVCRAGVPSVVVPHLADQPYWGGGLHQRGVAPKPVHRRHLKVKNLAERIQEVLDNNQKFERAQQLGNAMRSENGVKTAIGLIENFAGNNSTDY